jgi:hypothetical protein
MKLLFENWRKYLVNERKTDILYNKIGEYFINLLKEPNKYFKPESQESLFYSAMMIGSEDPGENIFYALNAKEDAFNKQEFKRYQQITGDTEIMPTIEVFQDAMKRFKIQAWAQEERPSAGADMNANGTMRIFFKEQPNDISDFLKQTFQRKTTLIHELGHWLNAIRSGYKNYRGSGMGRAAADKEFDIEADGGVHYARSTEEMQARVTEVFSDLKDKFSKDTVGEQGYLQSIEENNPRLFLRIVLEIYNRELYVDKLDASTKRRLINRILEMFNFFKENRDDYPALETLPETPIL